MVPQRHRNCLRASTRGARQVHGLSGVIQGRELPCCQTEGVNLSEDVA